MTLVPGVLVEAFVTPELTERGWVNALYVQAPEGIRAPVDPGVVRVEIGSIREQLASLRDDIEEVGEHASLDESHSDFLRARMDDVGIQLSAGNHAGARTLLIQFAQELQSLVEMGVLTASEMSALVNPTTALANHLLSWPSRE